MSKVSEDFNFKNLGNYDVEEIKNYISNFAEEWFIDTSRQEIFKAHKDTNSYFIYKADLKWKNSDAFVVEKKSNDAKLVSMIDRIILDLETKHDGVRGNVLLIKLKAGQIIPSHQDSGDYLVASRRHHIPIITSDNTWFTVGSDKINMLVGECWEINNTRFHSVENYSDIDRVHLLIDIMPKKEMEIR